MAAGQLDVVEVRQIEILRRREHSVARGSSVLQRLDQLLLERRTRPIHAKRLSTAVEGRGIAVTDLGRMRPFR